MIETKYEIFDERFEKLIVPNAKLEMLGTGTIWAEGPVYFSNGEYLLWSDITNDRIMRWSEPDGITTHKQPATYTNGHTLDHQGRLLSCSHGARRVTRTEHDGTITVLADNYLGKKLNSPNDIIVKSDGTIWFTDPPYGILSDHEGHKAPQEQAGCYVYRLDPETGHLETVATDRVKPNGLAFNLDESILYVSDTAISHDEKGWHHIFAYDVIDGIELANSRIFAEVNPGCSDGFRLDINGYIFTSSQDSIQVFSEKAELLGKIMVPEVSANCTFGGQNKSRLFITATTSMYAIELNTRGVQTT